MYVLRQGEVTVDPLRKITGPKNKKPLPVFLKESEMDKLLDDTDFGEGFTEVEVYPLSINETIHSRISSPSTSNGSNFPYSS